VIPGHIAPAVIERRGRLARHREQLVETVIALRVVEIDEVGPGIAGIAVRPADDLARRIMAEAQRAVVGRAEGKRLPPMPVNPAPLTGAGGPEKAVYKLTINI